MAFESEIGITMSRAGAGDKHIILANSALTPKLCIVGGHANPAIDSPIAQGTMHLGVASSDAAGRQRGIWCRALDSTSVGGDGTENLIDAINLDRGAVSGPFVPGEIPVNYSAADSSERSVIYIAMGGSDITEAVVQRKLSFGSTGTDDWTDATQDPSLVMFFGSEQAASMSIGAATSPTTQSAAHWFRKSTSDNIVWTRDDGIFQIADSAAEYQAAEVTDMALGPGFQLNWSISGGTVPALTALSMAGTFQCQHVLFQASAAAGPVVYPCDFEPELMILWGDGQSTVATSNGVESGIAGHFGASDMVQNLCSCMQAPDGGNSTSRRLQEDAVVYTMPPGASSPVTVARWTDKSPTSFTLTYDNVSPLQHLIHGVLFASAGGQPQPDPLSRYYLVS